MKKRKVDSKVRIGESARFDQGAHGGGVGRHQMSEHIPIGHVPADADQHHGKAGAREDNRSRSKKE